VIVAATALWLRLGLAGSAASWAMLLGCWAAAVAAGGLLQRLAGGPLARVIHHLAYGKSWPRDRGGHKAGSHE
jgi:hypothetical protein